MTESSLFTDENQEATPSSGLDYQALLNPAQYEAVTTLDGPVLVIAGAGSGKTRTLVFRVAYLVEQGVDPSSILLLTFTRKAAGEMLTRAAGLVGDRCNRVAGGTFHSLAHELLRRYATRLGYESSFGVMDRGDMEEALGRLRKESRLGEKDRRFPKRSTLATMISKAANKSVKVDQLLIDEYVHLAPYLGPIKRLAAEYEEFKKKNSLLDFDDLLWQLNRLLTENDQARDEICSRYQYIMVDEYQDVNQVQAEIVERLARPHGNVMAVGDDAQSIYSFRGASFKNIMKFPDRFPGTRIIKLEENYRSTQPILNLTNHIIAQAAQRYDKKLFTRRESEDKPLLATVGSSTEQSQFVCENIKALLDAGYRAGQIAVLFRAARHSYDLELELVRNGIDFVKFGGRRFLEAAHIKDLLSLLRVADNPRDRISLMRALMLLEGVGQKTAEDLIRFVDGKRANLMSLPEGPVRGKAAAALPPLVALWDEIGDKTLPVTEAVDKAWAFYEPIMEARFDDYPSREADVKEFLGLAPKYNTLTRFLSDVALEPPNASGPKAFAASQEDTLVLSTVHSAKGLEFKAVFVIGAADGRFPPTYAMDKAESLDEERRLMYVAATRAEDRLYMVCPLESDFGAGPMMQPRLSRFLADAPPSMWHGDQKPQVTAYRGPTGPRTRKRRLTAAPATAGGAKKAKTQSAGGLSPGDKVTHPVFGLGRIIKVENRKARVDFDHFGPKTLHLDFAGLKPAD